MANNESDIYFEDHKVTREFEEIRIRVPWGHLVGKWYGPKDVRPILAIHGWQDNVNSYNTLIPLMPAYISVLAIDLPGHGRSSAMPQGMHYHLTNHLLCIHYVMREYGWARVSLMGHSMGAKIVFLFAALYPAKVDMVITIDLLKSSSIGSTDRTLTVMRLCFDKFLTADERMDDTSYSEPPSYPYDELKERLYEGSLQSVDMDRCHHLLARNITKSSKYPEKYFFSRDERVKFQQDFLPSSEHTAKLAARITAPYLTVKGEQSTFLHEDDFDEIVGILRKSGKFHLKYVPQGTHHLHLNNPHEVAAIVNRFVQKYRPPEFELRHKL